MISMNTTKTGRNVRIIMYGHTYTAIEIRSVSDAKNGGNTT